MTKRRRWILLPLAALAAALVVLIVLFDWNWLKGLVEDQASAALGREIRIAGDLDVELGLRPRITVEDVRLANPPWASEAPMLAAAHAEAVVDLPALLGGRVELPEVVVSEPALSLETRPDGAPNWELQPDEPSVGPPTIPRIGRLQVRNASVRYLDHGSGRTVTASLAEVSGSTSDGVDIAATGEVEGEPLDLTLTGAPLAQLEDPAESYPLALDLRLAESDLAGEVTLDLWGDAAEVSADLRSEQVRSAELARLVAEAEADAAPTDTPQTEDETAPGQWLDFEQMPEASVDLRYTIGRLEGPDLVMQDVRLEAGLHDRLPSLSVEGGGTYRGQSVTLDVRAAPVEGAQPPQASYNIDALIEAGQTRITASGGIDEPERLEGLHLQFDAESSDATELLGRFGISLPQLPALQVSGQLIREDRTWRLDDAHAELGDSDIDGVITADLGGDAPAIEADLSSSLIRISDLEPLLSSVTGESPAVETLDSRLEAELTDARAALEEASSGEAAEAGQAAWFDFQDLPAASVDLQYAIERLEGPELTMQDVRLAAGLHDRLPSLSLEGRGSFRGEPVTLDVNAGPVEGAEPPQAAYDIDARIEAGQTRITASGEIDRPQRLQGVRVEFDADSPDATELLRQLGIEIPELPGLRVAGRLTHEGEVWRLDDMQAEVGESDLAGQVSADLSGTRPLITADLRSDQLLASDLMPGPEAEEAAEEAADEAAEEVPGLITASGVNFEALPEVDVDLAFQGGHVEVPDFAFDRLELELAVREGVAVVDATGQGTFREFKPVDFEAHAGTEESLEDPDARYPLDLALRAGDTRASATGTVDRPLDYTGLDVDVALEGPDLQVLGGLLQLPLPATPPYDLAGKVTHEAEHERWNLVALRGTVGDSDLSGDVSLELDAVRPTIVADLESEQLDFDDLGVLVGAPPATGPGETASPRQERQAAQQAEAARVLPDTEFEVPELRAFDARISFTAESIQARKLPLERLALEVTLDDGVITARPVRVDLAGGELQAAAQLDGREDVLGAKLEVGVRQIRVNELLSRFDVEIAEVELEREGVGSLSGRAAVEARGNSIHDMASSADGQLLLIMDGGRINALILEAVGLDIGEAVALLLSGEPEPEEEMVPVQCMVARFDIENGLMEAEALVLETSDATITGQGGANLGEETLGLELLAHPKDPSILTASTPVRIEGTFKEPEIDLLSEELEEKGLAALALGVVLPVIGAVLPFLEGGESEGPNCGRLIRDAQAAMPAAPPPDEPR